MLDGNTRSDVGQGVVIATWKDINDCAPWEGRLRSIEVWADTLKMWFNSLGNIFFFVYIFLGACSVREGTLLFLNCSCSFEPLKGEEICSLNKYHYNWLVLPSCISGLMGLPHLFFFQVKMSSQRSLMVCWLVGQFSRYHPIGTPHPSLKLCKNHKTSCEFRTVLWGWSHPPIENARNYLTASTLALYPTPPPARIVGVKSSLAG